MQPNLGETDAESIYQIYKKNIPLPPEAWLVEKDILEVGVGRTNGSCYRLLLAGARSAMAYEPFRPLDSVRDSLQRSAFGKDLSIASGTFMRTESLNHLPAESFDCILSLAVLEHVVDMELLSSDLWQLLRPGGYMLHIVDYRDHFFRYPYHHLLWSRETWSRWLDPGDLPRWRISDQIRVFEKQGFQMKIIKSSSQPEKFAEIKDRIHPCFSGYDDFSLKTSTAVIFGRKPLVG
jgi:SAM-dependent methyltransferase